MTFSIFPPLLADSGGIRPVPRRSSRGEFVHAVGHTPRHGGRALPGESVASSARAGRCGISTSSSALDFATTQTPTSTPLLLLLPLLLRRPPSLPPRETRLTPPATTAVLVPKKNRLAVYSYLFKEGVIVAHQSVTAEHVVIGVPNLQVIKLCISLKSRGYVTENFCWAHHYFYLTDSGITYLRNYLHLPADIVPATLKKALAPPARPAGMGREGEEGKDGGAGGDFKPSFRREGGGGYGRGRDDGYRREEGASVGRGRAL